MGSTNLPPCGIYKTTDSIGSIPPNTFVYFHNHGNPGPGVYPPEKWVQNRAIFQEKGVPLSNELQAKGLVPLPPEGFYRVRQSLKPTAKSQTVFQPGQLVQIGYNRRAETILFVPQIGANGLETQAAESSSSLKKCAFWSTSWWLKPQTAVDSTLGPALTLIVDPCEEPTVA